MRFEIIELGREEMRRPELVVAFLVLESYRLTAADLIVHYHWNAIICVNVVDGKIIIMWQAATAMETDERCLLLRELAPDPVAMFRLSCRSQRIRKVFCRSFRVGERRVAGREVGSSSSWCPGCSGLRCLVSRPPGESSSWWSVGEKPDVSVLPKHRLRSSQSCFHTSLPHAAGLMLLP
ncbi:hypothetical protein DOTSEDRAFT_52217 [Dothistroma septosporum NZE10]|uniref:Uncharacterized protein n=1 Tax=Dothistroma septosporum (strain NZE10 / CBS 128990) TaxID=675120 RepID=N1PTU2_DOTSN|nr:hypothetical protein DOTSEDRAFT_52217 [Dothistroma septosporum NZE10]